MFFQNVKKRGFDLESIHLQNLEKLKKLVALVSITYTFVANIGLHQHLRCKAIPVKNHGTRKIASLEKVLTLSEKAYQKVVREIFNCSLI